MAIKADVAREYRSKHKDMPTLKLARIVFNENKTVYNDVEDVRICLRRIEGKAGKQLPKDKSLVLAEARPYNPFKLPETEAKEIAPFKLKAKRIFLLNDYHIPYHDINAVTCAFNFAKKEKPDAVLINGDMLDFYGLSQFMKDPRKRNFAYELDQFKATFEIIQKTFKCKIYFKFGNHEIRYEHYLFQKAKELVGVDEFDLSNIIKARAEGIEVIKDKTIVRINTLNVIHGHELGRGFFNPVNAARGLHLRAKVSALQGDCHKSSEHTETDLEGKIKTTWSVGCLCGLNPEYLPYNSWNHGFAMIDTDSNGIDFDVRNFRIYKGKIL